LCDSLFVSPGEAENDPDQLTDKQLKAFYKEQKKVLKKYQ